MRVRVLYFAVVRERLKRGEEELELPDGATVGALLDELGRRHPAVAPLRAHLQVARNRAIAGAGEPLTDGDEVALIPPVSGGAGDRIDAEPPRRTGPLAAIRETPLDLGEVVRAVLHEGAG